MLLRRGLTALTTLVLLVGCVGDDPALRPAADAGTERDSASTDAGRSCARADDRCTGATTLETCRADGSGMDTSACPLGCDPAPTPHCREARDAAAGFDPSSLQLTGWWRAPYTGTPWAGTASAGPSGAHALATSGADPTPGAPVNGYASVDCSAGKNLKNDTNTWGDFITASAYTFVALVNMRSAATPATDLFHDPAIWSDTGGHAYVGMGYNADGAFLYHRDPNASYRGLTVPCAPGAWHLVVGKYDGTYLRMRVDSGPWRSLAKSPIGSMDFASKHLRMGLTYVGGGSLDGSILELMIAPSALSDADCDNIRTYVNARYGLAL